MRRVPRSRFNHSLAPSVNWSNRKTYKRYLKLYRWMMHYYPNGGQVLAPQQWVRMQVALGIVESRKERTTYPGW